MANKSLVYIPSSKDLDLNLVKTTKAQIELIPPYEDSGVKYQGKYKIKIDGNNYDVKSQSKWFVTGQLNSSVQNKSFTLTSKKTFVTSLIYGGNNNLWNSLYICDNQTFGYQPKCRIGISETPTTIQIQFNPPIDILSGYLSIGVDSPISAGDVTNFTIWGFQESI